jgi:ligand-binding SRPBCC domain-containing protein
MPKIELKTEINAPIERVFDLARCIDLHTESMSKYREKAVDGITRGLMNLGETVTWEAVHFGIRQRLAAKITKFDRPLHFRDEMVSGAFKNFTHDHFFAPAGSVTVMRDIFDYRSPFGVFGKITDVLFLEGYMTRVLSERNELIKKVAEGKDWQKFIS